MWKTQKHIWRLHLLINCFNYTSSISSFSNETDELSHQVQIN